MQPNVGRFIWNNPELVQDVLCLAQDRAALDDKQFLGVTFAAIMSGGKAWTKIPKLVAINGSKEHLLEDLASPL